jgi:hypothetical protein
MVSFLYLIARNKMKRSVQMNGIWLCRATNKPTNATIIFTQLRQYSRKIIRLLTAQMRSKVHIVTDMVQ